MAAKSWAISIEGVKSLKRGLKAVGETDVPYMREALEDAGNWFEAAAQSHAVGGIATATDFIGVKGTSNTIRAVIVTDHPGAKPMEFGRTRWRRGGSVVRHSPGQVGRAYYGIKQGTAAIRDTGARIEKRITTAISHEWDRLGGKE